MGESHTTNSWVDGNCRYAGPRASRHSTKSRRSRDQNSPDEVSGGLVVTLSALWISPTSRVHEPVYEHFGLPE